MDLTGTKPKILTPANPSKPSKPKREPALPSEADVPLTDDAILDNLYEEGKS